MERSAIDAGPPGPDESGDSGAAARHSELDRLFLSIALVGHTSVAERPPLPIRRSQPPSP